MTIELREISIDQINSVMSNEFVIDDISDDGSKGFQFESLPSHMVFYGVFKNDECVGFYVIHGQNHTTVEIHTSLLPTCRGKDALTAGKLIVSKIFETHKKIISHICEDNKKALLYSQLVGFTIEGINRLSIQKNGILRDQILVGMTKEEFKCQ